MPAALTPYLGSGIQLAIIHKSPSAPSASRGGMCANAFGGHERLDKCNLQAPSLLGDVLYDVVSGVPGERTLWGRVLADAINNYLFFGLGRNGTTPREFWYSCEFLFVCRSSVPETWLDGKHVREVYEDADGIRRTHRQTIDDAVLQTMCIDAIWSLGEWPMPLDVFTDQLKAERGALLRRNWPQVRKFLHLEGLTYAECEQALTCPRTPDELASVLRHERADLAVAA